MIALILEGNAFHKPGAATWNDLSLRIFLFLTNGVSKNSSLHERRLYRVRQTIWAALFCSDMFKYVFAGIHTETSI